MIREITPEDKPQILSLIEMFFNERLNKSGADYSPEFANDHFDAFIQTPNILALCAEVDGEIAGLIAGIPSAILFSKEVAMQELVWYVKPEKRNCGLRLLREFEKRTHALGIFQVMMVGMSGDQILNLYPRFGYVEIQKTFMKRLS